MYEIGIWFTVRICGNTNICSSKLSSIWKWFNVQLKKENQTNDAQAICFDFLSRQLIYNYPEQLFADAGVMAIEHADFEGVERLALVTGNYFSSELLLIAIPVFGTYEFYLFLPRVFV